MQKITKAELDVLHLITNEFLTPSQVAIRRGTTKNWVYKILRKLRKKGFINKENKIVHKKPLTLPSAHMIRLHREEWNLKILYKESRYKEVTSRCNKILLDGNTILLHRDSIVVFSGQSFYGESVEKVTRDSVKYWNRFMVKLENHLSIILLKPKYQNIKRVNAHYSETDNELSKIAQKDGEKIRIYATDDGKLWFTIDNSFNLHEAETLHPETAREDMIEIKKHLNDMRNNNPPTLSEIMTIIKLMLNQNLETATGLNAVVKLMQPKQQKEEPEKDKKIPDYLG